MESEGKITLLKWFIDLRNLLKLASTPHTRKQHEEENCEK
jgi:hypothetical protein